LIEAIPVRDSWDDTFYITYGKYGEVEENTVSAKLIYADYSLESEDAHVEIVESESENISAIFEKDIVYFDDICIESCSLDSLSDITLFIEVDSGKLDLERIVVEQGSLEFENSAPEFEDMPNISIRKNSDYTLDLNDYASDIDGETLEFSYYDADNVEISIDEGIATIIPDKGYEGKIYTFFIVNDSRQIAVSNTIEITVSEVSEQMTQGSVRIGQPVKWIKRVNGEEISNVSLDHAPLNITVKKIDSGNEIKIDNSKLKIKEDGKTKDIDDYMNRKQSKKTLSLTSESVDENELELIIEEPAESVEVEYYTEGPSAVEENITEYKKQVTISSDIHYTDITAFSSIDERPLNSIKLYHLIDGSRQSVEFDAYDNNDNGLIEHIEWIVPHLSEQTYEIEITVLNVQSYPTVGGEWEVRFTTAGKANLTISAINETSYGGELPDDLIPLELRCGDSTLEYLWSGNNDVYYNDYECNETGYWTVTVLTEGMHNQMFTFGDSKAYANNLAKVTSGRTNLTIWDSKDEDGLTKYSSSDIVFYANYSNETATANGTCTIEFNYSGVSGWHNKTNMTYHGPDAPWNYSRNITYKGTNYFNISCENSTMMSLNTTDSIVINNTAPELNLTPGGKLPDLICIFCTYQIWQFSSRS
jgi:hypothetical protein